MDARERAERIVIEQVRKAIKVGFVTLPITANINVEIKKRWLSTELSHSSPLNMKVFNVSALKTIQIEMLQQLFRRYGIDYSESEGDAMISVLIGGTLERYAKTVVQALPLVKHLLWDEDESETILAGSSTYALAQIAVLRLELERSFSTFNLQAIKKVYAAEFKKGKKFAARLEKEEAGNFLVIDFESAKQLYERACHPEKQITPEEDPFAIYVEDPQATSQKETFSSNSNPAEHPSESIVENLEKLSRLKEKGVLTAEEFETQKQKLLNRL